MNTFSDWVWEQVQLKGAMEREERPLAFHHRVFLFNFWQAVGAADHPLRRAGLRDAWRRLEAEPSWGAS